MKTRQRIAETIVISLGGSVIVPEEIDTKFLKDFRRIILDYVKKGIHFIIICGGGMTSRKYIRAAHEISGASAVEEDWIGIRATQLNAQLVRAMFGRMAHPEIIVNPNKKFKPRERIIVAAGYLPGSSTDYDAVLLAKNFKVKRIINISNIDHVYDKDPRKFSDARPIKNISWNEFIKMVGTKWSPGLNAPFDPVASIHCMKSGIRVDIIGKDIKNIRRAILGNNFKGTTISN